MCCLVVLRNWNSVFGVDIDSDMAYQKNLVI